MTSRPDKNISSRRGLGGRAAAGLALFFLLAAAAPVPRSWAADTNRLLQNALKLYEKGDYERAMKEFGKVVEQDPTNAMAREYRMLCSKKIVEKKLGKEDAQLVEKEVAAELRAQELAAAQPRQPKTDPFAFLDNEPEDELADLANPAESPREAKDILQQRESVADQLRRRHLGMENIVQLDESRGQVLVTLFMNRLFLPYSDVLRDDALIVLEHVTTQLRRNPKRKVVLKAVDAGSPAAQSAFPDLSSRRCTVVFSHLVYATYRPPEESVLHKPQ
jgi:tetratricopeptide (TPR) repeat protein